MYWPQHALRLRGCLLLCMLLLVGKLLSRFAGRFSMQGLRFLLQGLRPGPAWCVLASWVQARDSNTQHSPL